MTNFEKYEQNSSYYCKELSKLGYTPHTLVKDATADNISVWDYIAILFDFK